MCFRDYVFVLLFFALLMFVLVDTNLNIQRVEHELADFRQTVKVSQDSILVNVKKPVWWR